MGNKEEQKAKSEKYNVFMGTLMICVVYAVIALLMAVMFYFTEAGKEFDKSLGTFTRTFIVGAILVTIILTILVFEWTPDKTNQQKKDVMKPNSCPDYWELTHTDDPDITTLVDVNKDIGNKDQANGIKITLGSETNGDFVDYYDYKITDGNKNKLKNKCVYDPDIFGNRSNSKTFTLGATAYNNINSTTNFDSREQNIMMNGLNAMYNTTNPVDTQANPNTITPTIANINCNEVYPEYLADLDAKEYAKNDYTGPTNKYRCEYSKICNVPWSSIGC